MKFGSVCSGIEAASVAWESLGFEAQWFSEIEHFPSEVLKYRYPTVPNLGDMTKLFSNKTFLDSHIDLLVGGTPCQSFSVAGLRKGMEDPRGNLTLTFLSLIDIKKPKWIVWENVPGIISSNQGKDFQSFLDGLEEIGYICDVEILDAQYFGVAQRRRRVFVCGQSVDSILKERTITSALTIAQCLTEILHGILIEVLSLYEREPIKSDQASLSRDGVMRRMKLFGILTENCNYKNWQELLVEVFLKHHPVQKNWDLPLGEKSQKELTLEDLLMGLNQEGQSTLTEESLRKALEDLYEVMKLYTTLTLTRETIQSKISIFFQAGESISRLIARLSDSSPNSLSATLSSLTLLQELTNYARQTNSDIFSEMAGIYEVGDFLKQAQHRNAVIGYLGDWRPAAAVLFESESLQRDIKPSRKKRQEVTTDAKGSLGEAGEISCAGGNLSPTVTSKWKTGYGGPSGSNETGNMVYQPTIIDRAAFNQGENAQYEPRIESGETMSSLVAKGPHAVAQPIALAENTIGRQPLNGGNGDGFTEDGPMYTLNATGVHGVAQPLYYESHPNDSRVNGPKDVAHPVHAFKVRGGCEGGGKGYLGEDEKAFTISTTQDQQIAQPISWDSEVNCNINKMGTIVRGGQGGRTDGVAQPIAFQPGNLARDAGAEPSTKTFPTLRANLGDQSPHVAQPKYFESHPQDSRVTGPHDIGNTVSAKYGTGGGNTPLVSQPITMEKIAGPIDASYYKGQGSRQGGEREFVAQPIQICFNDANGKRADRPNGGCYITENPKASPTVTCAESDLKVLQPIAVDWRTAQVDQGITQTLKTDLAKMSGPCVAVDTYNYTTNNHTTQTIRSNSTTEHIGAVMQAAGFLPTQGSAAKGIGYEIEQAPTLRAGCDNYGLHHPPMAIRRLTPKECERLQGFPDDWTKIPYRNKPADQCPDGPRYKACGNSMAVPVMRWIGQRIQLIDTILNG